ncbi:MAG: redoxin domain-containing protein [Phycisphaeraceae bacterium]
MQKILLPLALPCTLALVAVPLYADTPDIVEAKSEFRFESQQGPWHTTQRTTMSLAYDRTAGKLKVDHPNATVVVSDGTLRATLTDADGYYIETAMPDMSYDALAQAVPAIGQPQMLNLVLLLADDPASTLAGEPADFAPADDATQILDTPAGTWQIRFNSDELAKAGMLEMQAGQMGPNAAELFYDYTLATGKKALDAESFALDTTGRQKVDSFQALVTALQSGGPAGGGGGGGGEGGGGDGQAAEATLVGNDAPDFTLARHEGDEKVELSDLDDRVVVLDFWATWCPPCVKGLPEVQAVHDWAKKENKPVEVFAVNLREQPGQVSEFLKQHDLNLPVLMDNDGKVAESYRVEAIPTTVVIAYGKIANVHVGLPPDLQATLQSEIEAAIEKQ